MKILYISCHAVLEYDELKLLTELGHEVHSHGVYRDPRGAYTLPRPGVEGMKFDPKFFELTGLHPKTDLIPELIEPYDTIIIMSGEHEAPLINNWDRIKHKRVIWRAIGQSTAKTELKMRRMRDEGLEIIRYSPKEVNLPNYLGGDAMIRFCKDEQELSSWNGQDKRPINFTQTLRGRGRFTHYEEISFTLGNFPGAKVYGPGNSDLGALNGGEIPYDELKRLLRDCRVFVYGGSWPASYTLSFIEAWMTGIPMVVMAKEMVMLGNGDDFDYYEVDELIEHGKTGFVAHSVREMAQYTKQLLENDSLALDISGHARQKAIELFGKNGIKEQWKQFLERKHVT